MAGPTKAQLEALLAKYIAAETAVLNGQEYRTGDEVWTLADLGKIQKGRREVTHDLESRFGTAKRPSINIGIRSPY